MKKFGGICVALVTPYDKDFKVNYDALARLVAQNLRDGVDGFFITGTTSEMMLLTKEERLRIMAVVSEAARGSGAYLISHIAMNSYRDTMELGEQAKELGMDAVALIPPLYYHYGAEELAGYYAHFSKALQMPFLVYDIPCNTGIELMSAQNRRIFDVENCIGAKASHKNLYLINYLLRNHPNQQIFIGSDEILLGALSMGVCGGIGSTYNVAGGEFQQIIERFRQKDMAGAQALQNACNLLVDAIIEHGGIPVVKHLISLRGIDVGECREPFKRLSADQKAAVEASYRHFHEEIAKLR